MESQVNEISPVEVEVTVEIPWDDVKKDLDTQYKLLGRSAKVRGFRPGKAPRNVLRQVYGRQVKGEVTAQLVEKGLLHAVETHELQIVAQPDISSAPEIADGKPLTFTAKVEVRPTVTDVDTSKLTLTRTTTDIPDSAVDSEVEKLRQQNADVQTPEPMRPSKAGDELTIDYVVSVDGEDKPEMSAQGRPVELGAEQLIPEFEKGLSGVSPGDEAKIDVSFGDDHQDEDLRGKTATFHITVKELREKLLPDLDDEFAKDCGDYATLLEMRLKIRERLEEGAKRRADSDLREQVIDKLVETNEIPAPPTMVKQEEQRMVYEIVQMMQMSGGMGPNFGDDFQKGMSDRAERKVKAAILLGAVAKSEKFEVTKEDMDEKLASIAEETGKHIAKVRVEYTGERRGELESQLLEDKLMDHLLTKATITDAPAEVAKPTEDAKKSDDAK
ncbi:MAG: trigger factor [Deltaproteobacteria bacterium]|nr:MAG: trigger factor [Deltaproteobacteria bacterium]